MVKGFTTVRPLFVTSVHPDFGGGHVFAILGVKVTP
jgi:hypothetical protein